MPPKSISLSEAPTPNYASQVDLQEAQKRASNDIDFALSLANHLAVQYDDMTLEQQVNYQAALVKIRSAQDFVRFNNPVAADQEAQLALGVLVNFKVGPKPVVKEDPWRFWPVGFLGGLLVGLYLLKRRSDALDAQARDAERAVPTPKTKIQTDMLSVRKSWSTTPPAQDPKTDRTVYRFEKP